MRIHNHQLLVSSMESSGLLCHSSNHSNKTIRRSALDMPLAPLFIPPLGSQKPSVGQVVVGTRVACTFQEATIKR